MRAIVLLCLLGTTFAADYSWNGPGNNTKEAVVENVCLTDQGSCGCCLMQKQFYQMESYFNTSLNAVERNLDLTRNILKNIKANRCAFSVALTNDRWCLGPFRDVRTIVYKVEFLNLCNGYNFTTGIFTVPRSGVYVFALTVYSDAGAPGNTLDASANLIVNSASVAMLTERNMQDQEDSATSLVVLQLKAGDKVWANLPIGAFLCDTNSHYNTFSGFLLYGTD